MERPVRNSSIELLRIIAMMGIIARHFVKQALPDVFSQGWGINKFWLEVVLNPLGKVGVTVFFIISAWFLCESGTSLRLSLRRVWLMERELLFWSMGIFLVASVFSGGDLTIGLIIRSMFPLATNLWWYATSYAVFLVLLPFLQRGLKALGRKNHGELAAVMFVLWTLIGGVIPQISYDMREMNVLEFIYLFVLVAWWKWYGFMVPTRWSASMVLAGFSFVAGYVLVASMVFSFTGKGRDLQSAVVDSSWTLPVLLIAFGLFSIAVKGSLRMRSVNWVAGSAFAVYLISQHPLVARWIWDGPVGFGPLLSSSWLPLISLGIVLAVFLACVVLDVARRGIFHLTVDRHPGKVFDYLWEDFVRPLGSKIRQSSAWLSGGGGGPSAHIGRCWIRWCHTRLHCATCILGRGVGPGGHRKLCGCDRGGHRKCDVFVRR